MMMVGLKNLYSGEELVGAQIGDNEKGFVTLKGVFRISGKCDGCIILSEWILGMDRYQVLKLDERAFAKFPPSRLLIEAYRTLVQSEVKSEDKGHS